jgi:chemotaxis protein methyltransferase CheR
MQLQLEGASLEQSPALKKLEEALSAEFGWAVNAVNHAFINRAVSEKAQRLGVSPPEYCHLAAVSPSELLALVEETNIGETAFFREAHQFQFLRQRLLSGLLRGLPATAPGRQLRVWSAACSTGEEAYSLAITINQVQPQMPDERAEVLATDLRNRALLEASRARYSAAALAGVDEPTRREFFEPLEGAPPGTEPLYQVVSAARRLVAFRRLNLFDRMFWRGVAGRFDLIVCANLLSSLSGQAARQLVANLNHALTDGGYLMVAPSEISLIHTPKFTSLTDEPSLFQKN